MRHARYDRFIVVALLTIHAGLLVRSALIHSPSIDEPVHLRAGLLMFQEENFGYNLGNPPLVDLLAAAPVLALYPDFELTDDRYVSMRGVPRHGERIMEIFFLARLILIPFGIVGGYCVYHWSGQLYGRYAGRLALTLWCFSPCILGFGWQITGDMAATAMGVLAAFRFWKWLLAPDWYYALLAGLAAGLALLTKMVWGIIFGLWPLLWLGWIIFHWRHHSVRQLGNHAAQMLLLLFVSVYVLNLGYLFEFSPRPLSEYRFLIPPSLEQFLPTSFDPLPIPLPYNYVRGIADIQQVLDQAERSYLAGQWKSGGWWYFYLYGMAVKLPLAILLFLAVAIMITIRRSRQIKRELAMLVPGLVLLVFISLTTRNMSTQYRYILPVYPFLFIYVSQVARLAIVSSKQRGMERIKVFKNLRPVVLVGLTGWAVLSSLKAYPHSMGYFHELAGGPKRGYQHFLGSSLSWGTELGFLRQWQELNCPDQPLYLAYRTALNPGWLDLDFKPFPDSDVGDPTGGAVDDSKVGSQVGLQAGWYAIDISLLLGKPSECWHDGLSLALMRPERCAFLHQLMPVDRVGNAILIYHITHQDIRRLSLRDAVHREDDQ